MFDLKKYKSVRGGAVHQAMRDWDTTLRELAKQNADLPPLDPTLERSIDLMPELFTDLSITATAVVPVLSGAGKTQQSAPTILGATLTAGQPVYADSTTTNPVGQLKGTLCGGTAAQKAVVGILLTGGNSGQLAVYAIAGQITMNSILTVATEYYMSANAGKIAPLADLVSTNEVIQLGFGVSATLFQMLVNDFGIKP